MPLYSGTEVSSSGSSSAVGITIRDPGGTGGNVKKCDIMLFIEPAKVKRRRGPHPVAAHHDPQGIFVWWKDATLPPKTQRKFSYSVDHLLGPASEGSTDVLVAVSCAELGYFKLHRRAILHDGRGGLVFGPRSAFKLLRRPRKPTPRKPQARKGRKG